MSIIRFTQIESGHSFEINALSENTIIIGENGADACAALAEGIKLGTVAVNADVTFWLQKSSGFQLANTKCIVITNYVFNDLNPDLRRQTILSYSDEEAGGLAVPLDSIYVIKEDTGWYVYEKACGLHIAEKSFDWEVVVTRTALDKVTRSFIKDLRHAATIIYPMGNNDILSLIQDSVYRCKGRRILILIDMYDVGKIYSELTSIQEANPGIRFYDYAYFGGSP